MTPKTRKGDSAKKDVESPSRAAAATPRTRRQRAANRDEEVEADKVTTPLTSPARAPRGSTKKSTPKTPSGVKAKESTKKSSKKKTPLRESVEEMDVDTPAPSTTENDEPPTEEESLPLPTKPSPTVDVTVHRIRHFDFHPKPIICIASTTYQQEQDNNAQLPSSWMAVSRESGTIELKTVNPKLRTIAAVAGSADTPLTVLAWTTAQVVDTLQQPKSSTQPVLIGAARNDLYVVDFWGTSQLVAKTPCAGGGIYCLQTIGSDLVAAGCQDGSIRIFRVVAEHNATSTLGQQQTTRYQLQAVSTVPSAGSAVLSLACRRPVKGGSNSSTMVGTVLFAGVADGTIRRYDCSASNNGKVTNTAASTESTFFASAGGVLWKSTLRMTVECYGRGTPTRVWALKAARDGTVVSGDSLGHVQFWDGDTGTLISSFEQNDNKADVLDMDMSTDECKVFASGVDSRVVCIQRSTATVDGSDNNNNNTKWIMTHAQRPHTHDVKAVTIVRKFKGGANGQSCKETEVLCTGGLDTKLCTYHVAEFGLRRPRALYPWPSLKSPIAAAKQGRLLTMLREDRVDLYELAPKAEEPKQMTDPVLVPEEDSLIGTVQVKGLSNLSCSAVSDSGQFLALSDSYSLLLFHLRNESEAGTTRRIVPCKIPVKVPGAASIVAMRFVQESRLVLATSDGRVVVFSLSPSGDGSTEMMAVDDESGFQADMVQTLLPSTKDTEEEAVLLPVHSMFGTKDGQWFATARNSSSQRDGKIDIYRRNGDGDTYQFWWSLPSLGTAVTAAAFLENEATPLLAVACVNYAMYVFDVSGRCLSKWSEKAGYPIRKLPADLAGRNDYPIRIGLNPASPSLIMMGSFGAIVAMNTDQDFPQQCRVFPETHVRGTKRKRALSVSEQRGGDGDKSVGTQAPTCTMCLRYNSMLFMDFVDDHELVVVEQPWLNVVATFPDALQRRVYGT